MRLAIAQSNLTLMGGAELVLLRIAQHYNPVIYTAEYDRKGTFPEFREFDIRLVSRGHISALLPYSRASQGIDYGLSFYNYRIREDYDVINAHLAPSHWIRNNNDRLLWYCHTPLRDIYDLYEYRMSMRKPYQRPLYRVGAHFVRGMDREVVSRIESIFANSSNTRSRILKYYNRDAAVLNGGVDFENYTDDGDGKYFLYPSRFSPNKRQEYALEAFRMFKKKVKGYSLVLCGGLSRDAFYYSYYKKIVDMATKVGSVRMLPNVSEGRLLRLYSRATAVLYSPVNEDYGLVPLQAMASRKPVISVNEGGPREVIKNGINGFLVDSPGGMAKRMLEVAGDAAVSGAMGRRGLETVRKKYSWRAFFRVFDKEVRRLARAG